jgi:hypothetical protein
MSEAPKGYLFKRWRGEHLPADSDVEATFYLAFEKDGRRTTVCLHTKEREKAEQLSREHLGKMEWGDRQAYLRSLIEAGERAKRELWGITHESHTCPVAEIWKRYTSSRRRPDSGPRTMAYYKVKVDTLVKWLPATVKSIRQVSVALAEEYVRESERKLSPVTLQAHLCTLRRVWRVVDPEGPQPWQDLRPAGTHTARPFRRLSLDECRKLASFTEPLKTRGVDPDEMRGASPPPRSRASVPCAPQRVCRRPPHRGRTGPGGSA